MQASPARRVAGAFATMSLIAVLGAAPTIPAPPATATDVLARVTRDAGIASYSVPVRIDVRLHKLISLHFHLNGMQYFKRPDRVALEMRAVPQQYRDLFAELGTPLTWPSLYDLRLVPSTAQPATYEIEGTPKHGGEVERMIVDVDGDVDGDASAPLHVRWFCRSGGTIDMHLTEQEGAGGYDLPQHAEADMSFGGYAVHASFQYGTYAVNEAVADAVFTGR
jgi:hypothetical protein